MFRFPKFAGANAKPALGDDLSLFTLRTASRVDAAAHTGGPRDNDIAGAQLPLKKPLRLCQLNLARFTPAAAIP